MKVSTLSVFTKDIIKGGQIRDPKVRASLVRFIEQNESEIEPKNLVYMLEQLLRIDKNITINYNLFKPKLLACFK